MSKQRHRRRSQGGTTPETTPQTGSGVAQFSVSEVAQFSLSVDIPRRIILARLQKHWHNFGGVLLKIMAIKLVSMV